MSIFGMDAVKICLFDDLKNNPSDFCSNICSFLDIKNVAGPMLKKENASLIPRSISLQYRLRTVYLDALKFLRRFGRPISGLCDIAMKINAARGARKAMSPDTKKRLIESYGTEVGQVAGLIQRDLSHWLK